MWVGKISVAKKMDPNAWLFSCFVLPITGQGVYWNRWSLTLDMFIGLPDQYNPAHLFNWLLPVEKMFVKKNDWTSVSFETAVEWFFTEWI
jgi:hypothetical protein